MVRFPKKRAHYTVHTTYIHIDMKKLVDLAMKA